MASSRPARGARGRRLGFGDGCIATLGAGGPPCRRFCRGGAPTGSDTSGSVCRRFCPARQGKTAAAARRRGGLGAGVAISPQRRRRWRAVAGLRQGWPWRHSGGGGRGEGPWRAWGRGGHVAKAAAAEGKGRGGLRAGVACRRGGGGQPRRAWEKGGQFAAAAETKGRAGLAAGVAMSPRRRTAAAGLGEGWPISRRRRRRRAAAGLRQGWPSRRGGGGGEGPGWRDQRFFDRRSPAEFEQVRLLSLCFSAILGRKTVAIFARMAGGR